MRTNASSATALPQDELQRMSRGALVQASNILHAGWTNATRKVEGAALRERLAKAESVELLQASLLREDAMNRSYSELDRKFAQLSVRHNALLQKHLTLERLVNEDEAEGDHDEDHISDITRLKVLLRSRRAQYKSVKEELAFAQGDIVKLERALRQRVVSDQSQLAFDYQLLCERKEAQDAELMELRENAVRAECQIKALQEEVADCQKRSLDDETISAMGDAGSFLSHASWTPSLQGTQSGVGPSLGQGGTSAIPTASQKRRFQLQQQWAQAAKDEEMFGESYSHSAGTQTENLVLQNVELLFRLQRDLSDLRAARATLESEAERHHNEKERLESRIAQLEASHQKKEEMIESMAAAATSYQRAPRNDHRLVIGAPLASDDGEAVSDMARMAQATARHVDDATRIAELERGNIDLSARLQGATDALTVSHAEVERLRTQLTAAMGRGDHMESEFHRLMKVLSNLAEDNAKLQNVAGMSDEQMRVLLRAEAELRASRDSEGDLQKKVAQLTKTAAQAQSLQVELDDLKRQLEQHQQLVVQTLAERDSAMHECGELTTLLHSAQRSPARQIERVERAASPHHPENQQQTGTEGRLVRNEAMWSATSECVSVLLETLGHCSQFLTQIVHDEKVRRHGRVSELVEQAVAARIREQTVSTDSLPSTSLPRSQSGGVRTWLSSIAVGPEQVTSGAREVPPHPLTTSLPSHTDKTLTLRDIEASPPQRGFTTSTRTASVASAQDQLPTYSPEDVEVPPLGLHLTDERGFVAVEAVEIDSLGQVAGLHEGDMILAVNSVPISTLDQFGAELTRQGSNRSAMRPSLLSIGLTVSRNDSPVLHLKLEVPL